MGIEYQDMRAILRVLKCEMPMPSGKLLILGDAVIHFTPSDLQELAMQEGLKLKTVPGELTPYSLGESLGFSQVNTLDINGKASINLNLQDDLPDELIGQFDLVIDAGVLFWCFEPGLALKNILRLSKINGLLFHISALSGYFGRGYYNIHPRLFEDFYLSNKCTFLQSSYRAKPKFSYLEEMSRRLKRLVGRLDDVRVSATYYHSAYAIYLGRVNRDQIEFSKTYSVREADMIPNNAIGTYAFRKAGASEPVCPIQTS